MPTVLDGSVLGDEAKAYLSATLGGAGALTELPLVIEDTISSERRSAESNCRGDAEIKEHVGKPKHMLSGTLLFKRGTPGATLSTMRTAYMSGTMLHWAIASGDITHEGQHVFRFEGKLKKWEQTNGDNETIKVAYEIAPDPGSTYASNWSVVVP